MDPLHLILKITYRKKDGVRIRPSISISYYPLKSILNYTKKDTLLNFETL